MAWEGIATDGIDEAVCSLSAAAAKAPSRNCLTGIVPDGCKQGSKRGSRRNLDMLRFA